MDIAYVSPVKDEQFAALSANERDMLLNALDAYARELREQACYGPRTTQQRCELFDMSIEAERLARRLGGE